MQEVRDEANESGSAAHRLDGCARLARHHARTGGLGRRVSHAGPAYTGCTSKTYTVYVSLQGPTGGTYPKPSDSCQDLNLMNADNGQGVHNDCYAGWYYSGGKYVKGAAGFVCKPNAQTSARQSFWSRASSPVRQSA